MNNTMNKVLKKFIGWKQLNPKDQSKSIIMALEGDIFLIKSKLSKDQFDKSIIRLEGIVKELKLLHKHYLKESW